MRRTPSSVTEPQPPSPVSLTPPTPGVATRGDVPPLPQAAVDFEPSIMAHYFRDVRRLPLLSHERELALAAHIQEGTKEGHAEILQRLLHVPLLLACRARIRRGLMPLTALCLQEPLPALPDVVQTLDALQRVRCHMRQALQQTTLGEREQVARSRALRAQMRALLQRYTWQPLFLQQAWMRFDTAMATPSPARQHRQAARYLSTLGYRLEVLRRIWYTLHRLHARVERARVELVTRNLRLVISVAREFSYTSMPLTDLIQEGNIGLMRAVEKFDYRRNLKFSTYAVWWIKQAMRRAIFEQGALIRVPEYMHDSARQVSRSLQELTTALGRLPTSEELARHLAMPLERVERSLSLGHEPLSLDRPMTEEDPRTLSDMLADPDASTGLEQMVRQDLIVQTRRALEELTPREAEVLQRHFGLYGQPEETLRQIGLDMHLSHERVRQIEAEALAKLKRQGATLRTLLEP